MQSLCLRLSLVPPFLQLGKEWYFNTNPGIYLPYQKLYKIVQGEQQSIVEMLNYKAEKYRSLGLPLLWRGIRRRGF
jgi:hypothetical protein